MPPKGWKYPPEVVERLRLGRWESPPPTPEERRERKRALDRAYYISHQDVIKARAAEWHSTHLERARARGRAYAKTDRVAANQRFQKWIAKSNNRAKHYARIAAYMAAHPEKRQSNQAIRRAREVGAFVEKVDRRIVLERANGLCGICGDPVDPARFDVDHIIPLVVGGEHSYANTQPAHPSCNYRKPKRLAP